MTETNGLNAHLFNRDSLAPLLAASAERHHHLCPRQVLGIRIGLFGLRQLSLLKEDTYLFDNHKKRLLTIVETDGCGADGVAVAADCHVGRRTLRVVDYGKMAATFVDMVTEKAVRVAPSEQSRAMAAVYAPGARSRWHAYLEAYQVMPDAVLLEWQPVQLSPSAGELISRPGVRVLCNVCGEEIINEREVVENACTERRPSVVGRSGRILCPFGEGDPYYVPLQKKIKPPGPDCGPY